MTWTLIVFIYAGMLARGDSVALLSLPNWSSEAACTKAGNALKPLVQGTAKELAFVCVSKP